MPGGVQLKKAAQIAKLIIGKPQSEIGARNNMRSESRVTPPSKNSNRSQMRPDDSSVGIRLW